MKKTILILASLALLLGTFAILHRPLQSNTPEGKGILAQLSPGKKYVCAEIFPQAQNFIASETSPVFYYALSQTHASPSLENLLGYVLFTEDFAPEVSGYSGTIKMALGISKEKTITAAKIISHTETPMYTANIDKYIQQFENKSMTTHFRIGTNIDGMTRATISSQAVINMIQTTTEKFRSLLNKESVHSSEPTPSAPLQPSLIMIPGLLFAFGIFSLYFPAVNLRWKILLVSFFYLGVIKATMLSTTQIINMTLGTCPAFLQNPIPHVLMALTLITLLIWGNIYCGAICPFAAVEETIYKTFSKFTGAAGKISIPFAQKFRSLKYIFLFALLLLGLSWENPNLANVEVFVLLFSRNITIGSGIFIALILILSIFYNRFWCRFLCPIGALNGLVASLSLHKIRIKDNACTQCQKCVNVCPMDALVLADKKIHIEYTQCILCGKCLKICPENAIAYKKPFSG